MIKKTNKNLIPHHFIVMLFAGICLGTSNFLIGNVFANDIIHGGRTYKINFNLTEEYQELIRLILNTPSIDSESEREEWINKLPKMTKKQLNQLYRTLKNEESELAKINAKYSLDQAIICDNNSNNECNKPQTPPVSHAENHQLTENELRTASFKAYREKNWLKSVELLDELLRLTPNDFNAVHMRGIAYAELGENNKAHDDIQREVNRDPNSTYAWNALCWVRILAAHLDGAQAACENARSIDPDDFAVTINLAHIYLLRGNKTAAWALYQKAAFFADGKSDVRSAMEDFETFQRRGGALKLISEAKSLFRKNAKKWLEKKAPVDLLIANAETAMEKGDYPAAIRLLEASKNNFENIYKNNSTRIANFLVLLGNAYLKNSQPEQTIQLLDRSQEIKVSSATYESRFAALSALKKNEVAEAILLQWDNFLLGTSSEYQRKHRINISNIYIKLAVTQEEFGNHEKALSIFEKALAIDRTIRPSHAAMELGWIAIIQLQQNNFSGANTAFHEGLIFAKNQINKNTTNSTLDVTNPSRLYRNRTQRISTAIGCSNIVGIPTIASSDLLNNNDAESRIENEITGGVRDRSDAISFLYCTNGFSEHIVDFITTNDSTLNINDLRNMIFYDISRPDNIGLVELLYHKYNKTELGKLLSKINNDEQIRSVLDELINSLNLPPGERLIYLQSLDALDENGVNNFYVKLKGFVNDTERRGVSDQRSSEEFEKISRHLESTFALIKSNTQ